MARDQRGSTRQQQQKPSSSPIAKRTKQVQRSSRRRANNHSAGLKMIPERTLVKISLTFTVALIAILVFNNLEPSEPQTITIHLCDLLEKQPEPVQNKVLAYNNRTLVNFVGHLRYVRRNSDQPAPARNPSRSYNAVQLEHQLQPQQDHQATTTTRYLPLKLFFVHLSAIDDDNQILFLICMCAAFKIHLRRVEGHTWSTHDLAQEVTTYIHGRKQEYRDMHIDLKFDVHRRRFHCDQPWQVPIENLDRHQVDRIVEPYDEISLHIEQLDLELNGGPRIIDQVFTKPIEECPPADSGEMRLIQ